jgi:HlyD family type I secretion membrane fusion protein
MGFPAQPPLSPGDVDRLEDFSGTLRTGNIVIAAFVVAAIAWLAFAPISGAVIGAGTVKVELNRQTVQHQEGGIVRNVLVRDGDHVQAGQTLIELGDVRVNAAYEMLRGRLDSELAKAARLDAERVGATAVVFAPDLLRRAGDEGVAQLLSRERVLFSVRRQAIEDEIRLIQEQLRETQGEIAARSVQLDADKHALALQQEELSANESLLVDGFISKTRLLTLQRALADYEARVGENGAELAKAKQRVAELNFKAATLRHTRMQEAAEEHKRVTAQVLDLQERVRASLDAEARQTITAPTAGEVVGLKFTNVGTVIGPREPIMDLVPADRPLEVEARIRPEDINYVQVGASADLRLIAFKQRITPLVLGTVTYVSADRVEDTVNRSAYYVAHIQVRPQQLQEAGEIKLRAGMPVEVFVKTSERTVLQYLIEPVTAYVRRSFREP